MNQPKCWQWDIVIDTTKIALERFGRAIVMTQARVLSSHTIGDFGLGRGISAFVRLELDEGDESLFSATCSPVFGEMKPPPRASGGPGWDIIHHDGHPGRPKGSPT